MNPAWLRHRAPDVLLYGGPPVVTLQAFGWADGWARQVGLLMFAVGTLWLMSRTMRIRAERRFDPTRHRSEFGTRSR